MSLLIFFVTSGGSGPIAKSASDTLSVTIQDPQSVRHLVDELLPLGFINEPILNGQAYKQAADAIRVVLTEAATLADTGVTPKFASDTLSVQIVDPLVAHHVVTDSLSIALTETATQVTLSGAVQKTASDTLSVSLEDHAFQKLTNAVLKSASDTLRPQITETPRPVVRVAVTDSFSIILGNTAAQFTVGTVQKSASDTLSLRLTESASQAVSAAVQKSASDTLSIIVTGLATQIVIGSTPPHTLSAAAMRAIFAQATDEVFLVLLTIAHPSIVDGELRFVNNTVNITSRGEVYLAFPFQVNLPEEREDQLGQVTLSIDNIDRQIVTAVRSLVSPPTVALEIILASSPDTVEAGPFNFTLRNAEYDSLTVSGTLMYEDILNEPFPAESFTPQHFAGLFR